MPIGSQSRIEIVNSNELYMFSPSLNIMVTIKISGMQKSVNIRPIQVYCYKEMKLIRFSSALSFVIQVGWEYAWLYLVLISSNHKGVLSKYQFQARPKFCRQNASQDHAFENILNHSTPQRARGV